MSPLLPAQIKRAETITELKPALPLLAAYAELEAEKARLLVMRPNVAREIDALVKRISPDDTKGLGLIAGLRNKVAVIDHRLEQIEEQLKEIDELKLADSYARALSRFRQENEKLQARGVERLERALEPFYADAFEHGVAVQNLWPTTDLARQINSDGPWKPGRATAAPMRALFDLFEEQAEIAAKFGDVLATAAS